MTEILTESFCERCGTRYTFEPVSNRRKPLSAIGTLGRGIKHFVGDPGSSLDEAFAVARSEVEQRSTATALEAFHRTFNFCLSCRQYTCADCWNVVEGRCLSCAPTPDAVEPATRLDTAVHLPPMDLASAPASMTFEPMPTPAEAEAVGAGEARAFAQAAAAQAAEVAREAAEVAREAADAEAASIAEAEERERAVAAAEAREQAEAEARAAEEAEAQALAAAEAEAAAVAAARAEAEAAAIAAAQEAEARAAEEEQARLAAEEQARAEEAARAAEAAAKVLTFQPGLNLDDEIAAYERELATASKGTTGDGAAVGPAVEVEVAAEVAEEPEIKVAAEIVAAAEVAEEPEIKVAAAADADEPVVAAPEVEIEVPAASAAASEPIPTAIGQPVPASSVDGPLRWPDRDVAAASLEPTWPDIPASTAGMATTPATAEPVPGPPLAARPCPSCGLSLSASARFCRRCGTPQQVADSPR